LKGVLLKLKKQKRILGGNMPLPIIDIVDFLKNTLTYTDNNEIDFRFSHLNFESGNIGLYEIFCLCSIVRVLQPELVMEFGTFNGRTTINIAHNLPVGSRIITVDLPTPDLPLGSSSRIKTKFKLADGKCDPNDELGFVGKNKLFNNHLYFKTGRIQQVFSDTALIQPSYPIWYNKVQLFFIDASHTYENCYNDSFIAYEIIKRYGLIIWHDYNGWQGVTKAVDQIYSKLNKFIDMHQIKDTSLAVGMVMSKEGMDLW
jgi:hypothetical protein